MDHLPLADGASLPPIGIPYVAIALSAAPYIHGEHSFIDFPVHHLQELQLVHPDLGPQDALLSLAQSWLFFGTLVEFFREPVPSDSFTRLDSGGRRIICTSSLHGLRSRWIAALPSRFILTATARQVIGRRCGVVLARATWALGQLERVIADDPRGRLVAFSIKLLLCSLCQTLRTVLYPTRTLDAILTRLRFRPALADRVTKSDFLLWDYMVDNGWCPTQINHLATLHCATAMVYLASIRRRMPSGSSHGGCLQQGSCRATQIDLATFKPSHVAADCACDYVSVDEHKIMAKLEDKKIPLIYCTRSASGGFSIEVISADIDTVFGTPTLYYAISHVWADGLGNPAANSLPLCQFERIYNKLKTLSDDVAATRPFTALRSARADSPIVFWMDVFCIPVERQGIQRNTDLKGTAIQLMDLTYSCAHQVLVLDAEMESIEPQRGSGDELGILNSCLGTLARATTCRWMTRSWTLQEGALASTLWIDYAQRLTPHKSFYDFRIAPSLVDQAAPEILSLIDILEEHTALPFVGRGSQDMTHAAPYCSSAREVQFLEVWNSLIGRSTTKPEDFHCILANLLDFSVHELLKVGRSDSPQPDNGLDMDRSNARMRSIIQAQKRLPMQLFCFQGRNALNGNKMGWLPEKPIGPPLTDDAFLRSVTIVPEGFAMEGSCLAYCFLAWPPPNAATSFCLDIPSRTSAHPHVVLDLPDAGSVSNSELLIYLNIDADAHTLLSESMQSGAAFLVTERQTSSLKVTYLCSVKFRHCWDVHAATDDSCHVLGSAVSKKTSILIAGPESSAALKFRRPARVGANLISTFPAKLFVFTAGAALIIGVLLVAAMAFPPTRRSLFHWPVIRHSVLLFYFCLLCVAAFYVGSLLFICARYISSPWIRKSYLTGKLPWYVRMLYWEYLPSILRLSMVFRRLYLAPFRYFLKTRMPYDVQAGDHATQRRPWLRRPKLTSLWPWRRRQRAAEATRRYMDDYVDDIPLSSEGGPGNSIQGIPLYLDDIDVTETARDGFEWLGADNADILRTIRRALVATQADGTGMGFWDIMRDGMVISRWIARVQKRRTLKGALFDYGLTRGTN